MLYTVILSIHSVVRWLVIISAVLAFGRAIAGWLGKKTWSAIDNQLGSFFVSAMDLQMLVGGILYFFLSPITGAVLRNFGSTMQNEGLRYFGLVHVLIMIVAMGLAHLGRSLSQKTIGDPKKFQRAVLWFGLAIVLILLAIPWPFLSIGRPWLRIG